MEHIVYLGLGSNIGDRITHIERAIELLKQGGILTDIVSSSYYRSSPIDAEGYFFINTVISARTKLTPHVLMGQVLGVEAMCGRKRYAYHNARTIDIDILLYDSIVLDAKDIILPHPRIQERGFVLYPLCEIAPLLIIPGIGKIQDIEIPSDQYVEKLSYRNYMWKGKRLIMGILNMTPDSFYDGGKYNSLDQAKLQAKKLIDEGADIIDIGGQSTRPGYQEVSYEEEIFRILPIVEYLRKIYPDVLLSIDTYFPEVVDVLSPYRIDIINSVSAERITEPMIDALRRSGSAYVITSHHSSMDSMFLSFQEQIDDLKNNGITDVIIDPGFGFGKTISENYEILGKLKILDILETPIMVGLSRKSMIYKVLDVTSTEALTGTIGLNMIALMNGTQILRVHDAQEARQILNLFEMYEQNYTR